MSRDEHDQGIPGPPPKPAFFDPREALLKEKDTVTVLGHVGPHDAIEVERVAAERETESAAEDKEDDTRH